MERDLAQPADHPMRLPKENNLKNRGGRPYDDEIDLIEVLAIIFHTLKKRALIVLLITLAAFGVGNWQYMKLPPLYKSSLIAQSDVIEGAEMKYLIASLKEELSNEKSSAFAKRLNLPDQLDTKIVSINLEESNSMEDGPGIIFKLALETDQTEGLTDIGNGLLWYIENHPFVQKKQNMKVTVNKELLMIFDQEKENIEDSKGAVQSMLETADSESAYTLFINHLKGLSLQKLALDEKTVELRKNLDFRKPVTLIQNLSASGVPHNKNYTASVGIYLISGLVLSLALVFTYELYLKIKNYQSYQRR